MSHHATTSPSVTGQSRGRPEPTDTSARHPAGDSAANTARLFTYANRALWLLPLYGLLLAAGSLTHEPNHRTDFEAYARYVSTDVFLASHLIASILGAAVGSIAVVALLILLSRTERVRAAAVGTTLTLVATALMSAAFGGAAFAQPGIGRAYLAGVAGMEELNSDTAYGMARSLTALTGTLLFVVAAVVIGTAVARASSTLRLPGTAYAVTVPLFAVSAMILPTAAPVLGLAVAATGAVIAVRLPRATGDRPASRDRAATEQRA